MSLMQNFIRTENQSAKDLKIVKAFRSMDFSREELLIVAESWKEQTVRVSEERARKYLNYVLTLKAGDRVLALRDFSQRDELALCFKVCRTR